jgi:hypothetical protein
MLMVADRSAVFEHLEVFCGTPLGGWLGRSSVLGMHDMHRIFVVVIAEVDVD